MPIHQKYPPVGCNMNDAGYPFRGDYRLQPALNHGHAGAMRKENTTLMLRITGSNLVIEKLQPSKGHKLQCELAIDDNTPRPINFPTGCSVVPVPGDGHEYNLTAIVQGAGVKHYCKMSLNGTEGKSIMRLRAPTDPYALESIKLCADGSVIYPSGGWYNIPIHAKDCSVEFIGKQVDRIVAAVPLPRATREIQMIMVQATVGSSDNPMIYCSGTGESVNLPRDRPVRLPVEGGPFTFLLPRKEPTTASAPSPQPLSSGVQLHSTETEPHRVPDVETTLIDSPEGSSAPPLFVVTAEGFMIELVGDNGTSSAGYGRVQLTLPDRLSHRVQMKVSDMTGRVCFRQTTVVPSTEPPSLSFSITRDATGAHTVKGSPSSMIRVDDKPGVNGCMGVSVADDARHVVTVKEGSVSAVFEVTAMPGAVTDPVATGKELKIPAATVGTPSNNESWVEELARALQCTDPNASRQKVQNILPRNPEATVILGFVSQHLFKTPPTIAFSREGDNVCDIHCPGYTVTASVDNGAACPLSEMTSIQIPVGHKLTLTALTPSSGVVAACCSVYYRPTAQKNLDEQLIARLLELFQRCGFNPEAVLAELQNITQPQSATGQQLVSYLVSCFRRLLECFQRSISLFAGDILPGVQLLAFVDDQPAKELSQVTPVTVTCTNNTVRFAARQSTIASFSCLDEIIPKLVDAYSEGTPTKLMAQLMVVPTNDSRAKSLVDLMTRVLNDYEAKLKCERDKVLSSSCADYLQFSCDGITMENVRTNNPCMLSFEVDGTGFIALEQGGQIPQGYSFPAGSIHCVHVVARDEASGTLRAEAYVTLKGTRCGPSTMVSLREESLFLDASVMVVMEEVHLRLLCPPKLQLKCDVDGAGNSVGISTSEYTARMNAACSHNVNVQVVDEAGYVLFQQRLVVPPVAMVQWALRLENNSLFADSCTASCTSFLTASLNRCPEKEFSCPLQLGCDGPQTLLLRKYTVGDVQGRTCVGEVYLMVPPFVDASNLKELMDIYREAAALRGEELQKRLSDLCARVPAGLMRDFIDVLIENASGAINANFYNRSADRGPCVHFRISGDETKMNGDR